MKRMSSEQATATEPAATNRFIGALEENGLLVIVLGAFAIVLVLALRKELVVDGWLALVSGRWIAQHGLPSHDTLTVWTHGRRWTDQQWLAQLALYGLWRARRHQARAARPRAARDERTRRRGARSRARAARRHAR